MNLFAVITLVAASLQFSSCLEREMTIHVNAKERECFFEKIEPNFIIDIEYQVIDGGHGDLDINFELLLNGRVIFVDYKKSDNIHRYEQKHPGGEVKFCFDNTISTFNRKTVFFELLQEDPDNPVSDEVQFSDLEGLSPEEFYEMKVQDITDAVQVIRGHLSKARQLQDILRSFEARDRNLVELNCGRVSLFSILIVLTMLCVGVLQVFMIRNLFDTNPKARKVWEKFEHLIK